MDAYDIYEHWERRCKGRICACCEVELEPGPCPNSYRHCDHCAALGIREVVMCFGPCWEPKGLHVAYLEADCRTHLPRTTRLNTEAELMVLVSRTMRPERALYDLERSLRAWGQGSVALHLTTEQYERLKR